MLSVFVGAFFIHVFITVSVVCCKSSLFRVLKHVFLNRFMSKTSLSGLHSFSPPLRGSCCLLFSKCIVVVQGFLKVCYFCLLVRYCFTVCRATYNGYYPPVLSLIVSLISSSVIITRIINYRFVSHLT